MMILNRQRRVRIPRLKLDQFLAEACRVLDVPVKSVTVCFVTNEEIAQWNSAYRGKKGPTDVLSFPTMPHAKQSEAARPCRGRGANSSGPLPAVLQSEACYLGDIAIAPEVARRNARRFRRSFPDEVRILILHGILHLMGYDHETDSAKWTNANNIFAASWDWPDRWRILFTLWECSPSPRAWWSFPIWTESIGSSGVFRRAGFAIVKLLHDLPAQIGRDRDFPEDGIGP